MVQSLKAIADENRMKILILLISSDLCVGALASHLGISKPAVSQHLRILREAGLVRGEKRGYWTHYMVERHVIEKIASELNKLGQPPGHSTPLAGGSMIFCLMPTDKRRMKCVRTVVSSPPN